MLRDIRLAFRAFRKQRTYALAVTLTLAVGVGASTSIFTFVDAALLQPPPFPEPSKLGVIWGVAGPERAIRGASFPEIRDWKERARTLQEVVVYDEIDLNMSIDGGNPARVDAEMVSWTFFQMLGARAVMGRTFTADEDAVPDQRPVAVISDALWRARFGASPDVFSRAVQLNDRAVTIVGIMAPGFSGLSFDTDVWIPTAMISLTTAPSILQNRGSRWLTALTRVNHGVSVEAAQADLDTVAASLARDFPDTNTDRGAQLVTLERFYLGDTAGTLRMLFGAVLLFLLVACSNVAALQLARSTSRRQETAVSLALGATRKHLARQLAAEAVVLGVAGALLGGLLASWMMTAIRVLQPTGSLPIFVEPSLNGRALAFAVVMAFGSALVAALMPVFATPSADVADALRTSGRAVRGGLGRIARPAPQQLLVVAQVAVALALLLGAGVVIQTLQSQLRVPLGFSPEGVTFARVTLTGTKYTPQERVAFAQRLAEALRVLPGAGSAAISDGLPFTGSSASILIREPDLTDRVRYYVHGVTPEYFSTLGMKLVAGRLFTGNERPDTPRLAILSESGARRIFPGRDPIGLKFRLGAPTRPEAEVVGVVADARFRNLTADLGGPRAEPDVFYPYAQIPDRAIQFAVRTSGPAPSAQVLQQAVSSIDPALPVYGVEPLVQRAERQTANARFTSAIMGAFSVSTLLLAGIGLYGLVSYVVSLSRREIALRLALGADRGRVVRMVVRNGMTLVLAGMGVGLVVAWALGRVWTEWIGTSPDLDVRTVAISLATLFIAGVVAT
ncbi:MAG: ABC transporter permease, partial [Acidobacteria bacterium]|nr:ABC transporter permease [Acidobacteriota bacterium]